MATYLFRSVPDISTSGRTLEGLAMPWLKPTRVRDLSGPAYLEDFDPNSTNVTLRDHPSFPLFVRHEHSADPIGIVQFQRSAEGLIFSAPLSKTVRADEMLELVNDGAMRSTSVGFRPIRSTKVRATAGEVTRRMEVALRELSLAPTGWGQYDDAKVLAIRTEGDGAPALESLRRRRALLIAA